LGVFFFWSFLDDENTPGNIFPVHLNVFDGRFRSGSDIGKSAFVPSNVDDRLFRCINVYIPVLSPDGQLARPRIDADCLAGDMDDLERLFPHNSHTIIRCRFIGFTYSSSHHPDHLCSRFQIESSKKRVISGSANRLMTSLVKTVGGAFVGQGVSLLILLQQIDAWMAVTSIPSTGSICLSL
jgi:hypothetical protein